MKFVSLLPMKVPMFDWSLLNLSSMPWKLTWIHWRRCVRQSTSSCPMSPQVLCERLLLCWYMFALLYRRAKNWKCQSKKHYLIYWQLYKLSYHRIMMALGQGALRVKFLIWNKATNSLFTTLDKNSSIANNRSILYSVCWMWPNGRLRDAKCERLFERANYILGKYCNWPFLTLATGEKGTDAASWLHGPTVRIGPCKFAPYTLRHSSTKRSKNFETSTFGYFEVNLSGLVINNDNF